MRFGRDELPPCLGGERSPLDPTRTVGLAEASEPGSNCKHGCNFGLCPYPPKGAQPRVEMGEAFCRRQQTLLLRRSPGRRRAPWQQMPPAQLNTFWAEMADRARGSRPRATATDRSRSR